MRPSEIKSAVMHCLDINRPAMLWGPPGVGKSDMIEQIAKEAFDGNLVDFRLSLRDPTDLKGFPMPDQKSKKMVFYRDGELPTEGKGILFMDEIVSATPATQAAGMQLTLTGRIGDYKLPPDWRIVAAGNRESDRGVVHRMPTPLANRFSHLDFEHSAEDWVEWALDNNISAGLIAFVRFRPELLFKFDPKMDSKAFPTPRSWVATENMVNERAKKLEGMVKFGLLKGTVGEGPGSEYWAFLKMMSELPSIDDILLNPDSTPVPQNNGTRYAIGTLLASKVTVDTFPRFMKYMARMDAEYQVVFARDAIRRDEKIKRVKEFTAWAMKNHEVIAG
jgi:hypothetical protein